MTDFLIIASTYVAIQTVLALGLNVQYGLGGLLNLAYILFVAAGAYGSAVLTSAPASPPGTEYVLGLEAPFVVGVVGGTLFSAALSLVVGSVALRNLRADYFAIMTLVFAAGSQQIVSQFRRLFNGSAGMIGIPQPAASAFEGRAYGLFYLGICVVAAVVTFGAVECLRRSPFGRALRAVREDESAAAAFGRNVYWMKLRAFVIGGAIGGFGGALLGAYVTAFAPAGWGLGETLLILVCLFVGGAGNNVGAVVGSVLVIGLLGQLPTLVPAVSWNPDFIADLRFIVIGLLIIVFLRVRPSGIVPEPRSRQRQFISGSER